MDNEDTRTSLTEEELRVKRLQLKWLRMQKNRLGYGLSLGAILLFLGLGGGKVGLVFAGGLAVAVGLYFYIRFERERRELEEELGRQSPGGVTETLPPKEQEP